MKYFSTAIWDPSQGQPHFVAVGYLDGQLFVHYDSHSRRMQPRVSWMEKVGKDDPQYWDRESSKAQGHEEAFKNNLKTLRSRYNQSQGLLTWQRMSGCELLRDRKKDGFDQYGYEGRTFIIFDKETLIWVASEPQAQITQRKWNADSVYNQKKKAYLEGQCIEWLEKYLSYGNETLLRTDPPVVTVTRKTEAEDGMETHICRMDTFYPREIDASWTRDGEVWLQDTFHGSMVPNADGTYHYWLSIQIDPKERDRYRCHVEHDGLQEPLDVALKVPESNWGVIIGCVVTVVFLVCVIVGISIFYKKCRNCYNAASTSGNGSDNSGPGRIQVAYQPPCREQPVHLAASSTSGQSQQEERGEKMGSTFFRIRPDSQEEPSGPSNVQEPGCSLGLS